MTQESKLKNAILRLHDIFPFAGYIEEDSPGIRNVASTVMRYARPGARVLDFGSGPMDKTAALQLLGYRCSATDDLQDFWHLAGDNRAKILGFAKTMGIDFHLADRFAFESNSFDMAIMCDVLEHIHDSPRTLLNNLLRIIKPQGYLMILVPNAVNLRKRVAVLCGRTTLPKY